MASSPFPNDTVALTLDAHRRRLEEFVKKQGLTKDEKVNSEWLKLSAILTIEKFPYLPLPVREKYFRDFEETAAKKGKKAKVNATYYALKKEISKLPVQKRTTKRGDTPTQQDQNQLSVEGRSKKNKDDISKDVKSLESDRETSRLQLMIKQLETELESVTEERDRLKATQGVKTKKVNIVKEQLSGQAEQWKEKYEKLEGEVLSLVPKERIKGEENIIDVLDLHIRSLEDDALKWKENEEYVESTRRWFELLSKDFPDVEVKNEKNLKEKVKKVKQKYEENLKQHKTLRDGICYIGSCIKAMENNETFPSEMRPPVDTEIKEILYKSRITLQNVLRRLKDSELREQNDSKLSSLNESFEHLSHCIEAIYGEKPFPQEPTMQDITRVVKTDREKLQTIMGRIRDMKSKQDMLSATVNNVEALAVVMKKRDVEGFSQLVQNSGNDNTHMAVIIEEIRNLRIAEVQMKDSLEKDRGEVERLRQDLQKLQKALNHGSDMEYLDELVGENTEVSVIANHIKDLKILPQHLKRLAKAAERETDVSELNNFIDKDPVEEDLKMLARNVKQLKTYIMTAETFHESKLKDLERAMEEKDEEIKGLQGDIDRLEKTKTKPPKSARGKEKVEDDSEKRQLKDVINKHEKTILSLQREKDKLLNRLSQLAGAKLTSNNAAIADLSDPNRPTKIAEQYNELYDNEWTDAFDKLRDEMSSDEKIIVHLQSILLDCHEFCKQHAHQQWIRLLDGLYYGEIKQEKEAYEVLEMNESDIKQISDVRRATAERSSHNVLQLFKDKNHKKYKLVFQLAMPFMRKCIHTCWLMSVQNPQVELYTRTDKSTKEPFDLNMYRFYTQSGEYLDYIVWPPLLLHKGGPLLQKGVAQPKKSKT